MINDNQTDMEWFLSRPHVIIRTIDHTFKVTVELRGKGPRTVECDTFDEAVSKLREMENQ